MPSFKTVIESDIRKLNIFLENYIDKLCIPEQTLKEALKYTLLAPSKRLRGLLVKYFYEFFGGESDSVLNFAGSIEMIHAYSLIHDDLPCMDNSPERRGKLSSHLKFGEDIALLVGDALLTNAFEIISKEEIISLKNVVRCINILSKQAGAERMIRGQYIDLKFKTNDTYKNEILNLCSLKTGSLFMASCEVGALLAGAQENYLENVRKYAYGFGICFQLIDDILDGELLVNDLINGVLVKDMIFELFDDCKNAIRAVGKNGLMLENLVDTIKKPLVDRMEGFENVGITI